MTQPARQSTVGEISTLLGQGSEFEGKLTFEGTVRIDGVLKGEVFSNDVLIVGEGARLEAEIDVGEIIIQGTVIGNIRAKRSIEVLAPGRVNGDMTTPSLQIEKGVIFEGRSFMEGQALGRGGSEAKSGASKSSASESSASGVTSSSPSTPPPGPKSVK